MGQAPDGGLALIALWSEGRREGGNTSPRGDPHAQLCPRTWRPKVPEGHLLRLRLPGRVLRHALVDTLVRLPRVLNHQGPIIQQVQAGVCLHAQLVAAETGAGVLRVSRRRRLRQKAPECVGRLRGWDPVSQELLFPSSP